MLSTSFYSCCSVVLKTIKSAKNDCSDRNVHIRILLNIFSICTCSYCCH